MTKKILLIITILFLLLGIAIYAVFYKSLLPQEPKKYITPQKITNSQKTPQEETTPSAKVGESITVTGVITRMERPAPDISYDYRIELDKPIYEEAPGGGHTIPVYSEILTSNNDSVNSLLEFNVGKNVKLTGSIEWGYAETLHFLVTKVETEVK